MRTLAPLAMDVLLVALFCVLGRRSHDEAMLAGLVRTLWPFGTGLAIGWLIIARRWATSGSATRPAGTALVPTGVVVWATTLSGGMLLRVLSGQGIAVSFVLVAGTVLAVFLLGWRAVFRAVTSARQSRP